MPQVVHEMPLAGHIVSVNISYWMKIKISSQTLTIYNNSCYSVKDSIIEPSKNIQQTKKSLKSFVFLNPFYFDFFFETNNENLLNEIVILKSLILKIEAISNYPRLSVGIGNLNSNDNKMIEINKQSK